MGKEICERCGKLNYSYDMVRLIDDDGKEEDMCNDCFNKEMALNMGIDDFNDYDREYQACDADGTMHTFRIRKQIAGIGIIWEANEIQDEEMKGYKFQVLAKFDEDQKWALQRLYYKIRKELSNKYIKSINGKIYSIKDGTIRGRIELMDKDDSRFPHLVIDGKTYTWEQLGDMLIGYDEFDFKLKLFDQIYEK
ncbi:DUF7686 domain-containing protein [Paramaledivibacter caminithermalis]|uniref:Uncharacterized protein n=1 Tax=Paramaledivibacter caminithermalis (strain DSM 15212 / CIP 107654 / DViRD3) TaxID=1121301 RepID=A0A1M6RDY6_PARC5|nr:hypothetical protein [Paramaledivibacter caminithermalis]SHK30557.1 hypothetical protein SAMN02745912_02925 [Paramaledivibacter caminithermalis DSM 15212]